MSEGMLENLSLAEKLAWIHERMKGVTEEEALAALREDEENDAIDREALKAYLATIAKELEQRYGSVSTQTLQSRLCALGARVNLGARRPPIHGLMHHLHHGGDRDDLLVAQER